MEKNRESYLILPDPSINWYPVGMDIGSVILIILGLTLFEVVSSIDNAVINAEVLSTMGEKARKWFLLWGMLFAVLVVRGVLPFLIVWSTLPELGPIGAITATFSSDPIVIDAIETSAPILLVGGGIFLIFLFFHWLFLEPKSFGLKHERFFQEQGIWFYAVVSILLAVIVYAALQAEPLMAFGAVLGSTAFFITHGFKQNAEAHEQQLLALSREPSGNTPAVNSGHHLPADRQAHPGVKGDGHSLSDLSKILYLEIIDATFSIDGVLGAFAFTLSVPLILLGNGIGALVVRQLTVGNIDRIKRYKFLKNGAMYSMLGLGTVMLADSFGAAIPEWISPVGTFLVIGWFYRKSLLELER
jgi:hypothetical protein